MSKDEYTPEVELEENQNNEVEEEVEKTESETKDWESEAKKWQAIAQRKAKQAQKAPEPELKDNYLTREEGILIAKGMSDEDIDQLKIIAKGKDISLLEAQKDPLFQTYYEKVEQERKSEAAKLGASKGSKTPETKPSFSSGLSRDEHRKLWKDTIK